MSGLTVGQLRAILAREPDHLIVACDVAVRDVGCAEGFATGVRREVINGTEERLVLTFDNESPYGWIPDVPDAGILPTCGEEGGEPVREIHSHFIKVPEER